MLDTYWSYLTHGAVDITSVIRPQASDLRARAQRLGGDLPDTEVVTLKGSEVTLAGSCDDEGHDAPRPDPPGQAGVGRPVQSHIYPSVLNHGSRTISPVAVSQTDPVSATPDPSGGVRGWKPVPEWP